MQVFDLVQSYLLPMAAEKEVVVGTVGAPQSCLASMVALVRVWIVGARPLRCLVFAMALAGV